jgi:hypothetical protein
VFQLTLKYIFNLLLTLMLVTTAAAQSTDTVKHMYLPTGLRVGTDMLSIVRSYAGEKFDGWEVNADIDFYKYYVAVDYGNWARHLTLPSGDYENKGTYFRVGADVNLLAKDPDRNMIFFGLRYGQSSFREQLNYESTDIYYGTLQHELENSNMTGRWGELTTGLRVKIWKGLWMGYTARLKFRPRTQGGGQLTPYEIPGYGLAASKNYWGFNYQIFWKIPFRKD